MPGTYAFFLNGRPVSVKTEGQRRLLWVLRHDLGLQGTKVGCEAGLCGACTVLLDGEPVRACQTPLAEVAGRRVTTIEGLALGGRLHPLQEAFERHHAFQCGTCTSGMLVEGAAFLEHHPDPTRLEAAECLEGHLCRCGSHPRILDALLEAAHTGKAIAP